MKRTLIKNSSLQLPERVMDFISEADIYDSSSSPEARVYFIDKGPGYYLKAAAAGALEKEAVMTEFFNKKGLSPAVIEYIRSDRDFLLTERALGEDCTHQLYLSDPKRLCILLAERLRELHEMDFSDCPVQDRVGEYLSLAEKNYRTGCYDSSAFPNSFGYASAEEAYSALQRGRSELKNEVLIHGDYCLPNIMLDGWKFSSFIDLGNGGVGDRHIDIFWGVWTLWYNFGTDKYTDLFFDSYGREKINTKKLKTIAAAEVFG